MTRNIEANSIYDTVDAMMRMRLFKEVDFLLEHIDINSFLFMDVIDVCISLLVVTLPAKNVLTNRSIFVELLRKLSAPEGVEGLLKGLE